MTWLQDHLVVLPIVVPLAAGAFMVMLDERRRAIKIGIASASIVLSIAIAVALAIRLEAPEASGVLVYSLGAWPARFGIALVVDRLSAIMLLLSGGLGLATLIFSLVRWVRAGTHFLPLHQFLLAGLNGAFLAGDLFNLFVFFEVLLASSYGLALHGSGAVRVKAGLHYIAINLMASSLFLIGVSLIYSVCGTLNMADLAMRLASLSVANKGLADTGLAILGLAFLIKAGVWPLCFWLPPAYAAASPPVSAFFAVMTKVGVYSILRLGPLFTGGDGGLIGTGLFLGGIATLIFGTVGALASQDLTRLGAFNILVSSGTLLSAVALGHLAVTAAALFYLVSSTLSLCAFFLLIELAERGREAGADVLAVTLEAYGGGEGDDADDVDEVGIAVPATMAVLGASFIGCAVLLAGLPPLSGFVAKTALLTAIFNPSGLGVDGVISNAGWALAILSVVSSLAALISTTRAGIRTFWPAFERSTPHVRVIEVAPVLLMLGLCAAMTIQAGPTMRYMQAAAQALHDPQTYIHAVSASETTMRDKPEESLR